MASEDALRRDIAFKLGRVIECTRMLDLNRSDRVFRRGGVFNAASGDVVGGARTDGGEIIYVLDTNVIQSFVSPMKRHPAGRLFHDFDLWSATETEKTSGHDNLAAQVAARSVLLATEYLLSEKNDGGPSDRIYMSRAHLEELEVQIDKVDSEFRAVDSRKLLEMASRFYAEVRDVLSYRNKDRRVVESVMKEKSVYVGRDIDISDLPSKDFEKIRDNYIVSEICGVISNSGIIDEFQQIKRLDADEFWKRFYVADWIFDPRSTKDRDEIKESKNQWLKLLRQEVAKRKERSKNSLDADAATLAMLSWATREKAGPKRRVVFVTGDSVVLNVYRKWFDQFGENSSFMIRPLSQFMPQYILSDTDVVQSEEIKLFNKARQALEASTYSATFSLIDHYYKGTPPRFAGARARDRFCIEADEQRVSDLLLDALLPVPNNLRALERKNEELDTLADAMRWLERLSIGALPHLVRGRIGETVQMADAFLEAMEQAERDGESSSKAIEKWLGKKLNAVMKAGFRRSLPIAVDRILAKRDASEALIPARASLGLRIRFPYRDEELSARIWLDRIAGDDDRASVIAALVEDPARVFALGSWHAMQSNQWSDAVRFADLASRASEDQKDHAKRNAHSELHYECLYLTAFSSRMRMASQAPGQEDEADVWRRALNGAEEALAVCIQDHERNSQPLRLVRAFCERASARLTYCAWAAVGALGDLPTYRLERLDLKDVFRGAVEDLIQARARLPEIQRAHAALPDDDPHKAMQKDALSWVELQASLSPECARIVYERLLVGSDRFRGEAFLPRMDRIHAELEQMDCDPSVEPRATSAVLKAYFLSAQLRSTGRGLEKLLALEDDRNLQLDSIMLDVIRQAAVMGASPA